jgi:hypothetical protein
MDRLIAWYSSQCNGLWKHEHGGFKISTLDNPAIRLTIDLNQTSLQDIEFVSVQLNYDSDVGWLTSRKTEDNFFDGCCSPEMFGKLLDIFVDWVDGHASSQFGGDLE